MLVNFAVLLVDGMPTASLTDICCEAGSVDDRQRDIHCERDAISTASPTLSAPGSHVGSHVAVPDHGGGGTWRYGGIRECRKKCGNAGRSACLLVVLVWVLMGFCI